MTNVLNLSVSLRRKTDGSPHSVAQTYWIKKDVSPLLKVPENRQNFKYTPKAGRRASVVSTDCSFCWCMGYLAVPQATEAKVRAFRFRQDVHVHMIQ